MTEYTINLDEGTMHAETSVHACLRDQVRELINQRSHTRETICSILNVNRRHLSTLFAQLRLQGDCPVTEDGTIEGVLRFISSHEWEAVQASRAKLIEATKAARQATTQENLIERLTKVVERLKKQIAEANEERKALMAAAKVKGSPEWMNPNITLELDLLLKKLKADRALAEHRLANAHAVINN